MTSLDFDPRHKITLFHAAGPQKPFPCEVGSLLTATFLLDRFPASEEVLHDVAPDARWFAILYPQASNEKYDPTTMTMLLEISDASPTSPATSLRWEVDHEDTFLAVATPANDTTVLDEIPFGTKVYVRVRIKVEAIEELELPRSQEPHQWYAKLVPAGKLQGQLIRTPVEIKLN